MSATTSATTQARGEGRPVAGARPGRAVERDFAAFYAAELRDVVGLVYALTGSWAVAEDLAQEAFVRAYRRWDDVAGYERPDSWLRTVAANLATSRGRRLAAEARALTRLRGRGTSAHHDALPVDAEAFWAAVRRLPPRQAESVALRYQGELTVTEIAEAMGCAEGTVKAHLHGARRRLSTLLGAEATAGEDAGT